MGGLPDRVWIDLLLGSFLQVLYSIVFEALLSVKYKFLLSLQCFGLLLIFDRAMLSYKRRFDCCDIECKLHNYTSSVFKIC